MRRRENNESGCLYIRPGQNRSSAPVQYIVVVTVIFTTGFRNHVCDGFATKNAVALGGEMEVNTTVLSPVFCRIWRKESVGRHSNRPRGMRSREDPSLIVVEVNVGEPLCTCPCWRLL